MKKLLHSIIALTAILLFSNNVNASHIPGANISYKCIGPNQYEITLWTIVRCPSSNPTGAYVYISNDCGIPNTGIVFGTGFTTTYKYANYAYGYMQNDPLQHNVNVSQICNQMLNSTTCNGGTINGVRMTVYKGIVTLPAGCNSWHFSWNSCCRDNTTNVTGQPGIWIETTMNSATFPCDNSPFINATPIPYACANQQNCYNLNVTDPDGDSLRFALIAGQSSAGGTPPTGTPIPYKAGYSPTQPIPGVTINPNNGTICFNAAAGNYVFAVMIYSYDRATGQLKGTMIYDFQVILIACTNNTPQPPSGGISNATGGMSIVNPTTVQICEGSTGCFDVVFNDPDPGNTLYAWSTATTVLPGINMTTLGTNPLTVRFCYTAPYGNTGLNSFNITVTDSVCPIYAQTSFGVDLRIVSGITANAGPDVNVGCNGTTNLTVTPGGGTGVYSYQWGGSGSGTNQSLNNVGPGTYYITVSDNGTTCSATDTVVVTGGTPPIPAFNATSVCPGIAMQFNDASVAQGAAFINGWQWDILNNGTIDYTTQNPTHTFPAPGTYPVKLIVTDNTGCKDSIVQNVTVYDNPSANFNSVSVCAGTPMNLTDASNIPTGTITGWQWDILNDGSIEYNTRNASHTFATAGNYNVKLIVTSANGCKDSIVLPVTVINNPTANFSSTTVCEGNATSFTDLSTPIGINNWSWDINNDGTVEYSTQNPNHTFPAAGNYNVELVVSAGACKDSIVIPVTVNPLPAPSFTFTSQCEGTAIAFNNTSVIASGTISNYTWDFGDNSPTSSIASPNHIYTACGNYTVKLYATSASGCIDSVSQSVQVYCLPTAAFTADTVCIGNQTCFYDASNVIGSNITQWQWSFGDGGTSAVGSPCYTYATANEIPGYAVKLVVTSNQGCKDSITHLTPVYLQPTANFTATNECLNDSVVFTNTSTSATNYNWYYGNATNSTNNQPIHKYKYSTDGSYVVKLVASTGKGCSDSISKTIVVHPIPTADFNFTNVCDGLALPLNDLSVVGSGNIINWDWNYGDLTPNGNTQNTNHTYANCGQYNVTLTVTSDSGCTDVITKQVEVYPNPVPAFTPTDVCLGTPSQFTDLTTVSCGTTIGSIINWNWDFGGTGNSSAQNPNHSFNQAGVFNTTLIVTTSNGCIDSITSPVTVYANPDVNFTSDINDGCTPVCVNFINNSNNPVGVTTYTWDFGNGNSAIANAPSHCYDNNSLSAKSFDVTVMAITSYGINQCTTIVSQTNMISVYPLPSADFTWNPEVLSAIYQPEANFTDLSQGASVWSWNFGDGGTANSQNPSHQYGDSGTYVIWLNIENQYGCKDSIWKTIRVEPEYALYIPNTFTPDGDGNNDYFAPKGYGIEEQSMLIFDRWGEVIFEGYQLDSKWDGKVKNRSVGKTDVYTYKIETKDIKGESHTYIGKVTLLK